MSVEIETEAAQFPEKEYINWIFVAVDTVCFFLSGQHFSDTYTNIV